MRGMAQAPPRPPVIPSGRKGIAIKVLLMFGLLALGKVASMAQRGAVGTDKLRLTGIVVGEILLLIVSLVNVDFVFYVLLFYLPFASMMPGDYGTAVNITNVLIMIIMFGLFCRSVKEGRHFFVGTELDRKIGLYLLLVMISFFRASLAETMDWFILLTLSKRFCTPILLYYLTSWLVREREQVKNCMFAIMVSTLMVAFLATKDMVTPTHFDWERRAGGVAQQANILAAFFAYYTFYFISYLRMNAGNFRYWMLLACVYPCARGIMLTFSRGGYIAFAAGMLYVSYLWKKGVCVVVALSLLIVWIAPDYFLPGAVVERLKDTVRETEGSYGRVEKHVETSAEGRILIWKGAVRMIIGNPLLGVGYGQFPLLIGGYQPRVAGADAHNSYILIAAEMGVPTLLIFMYLLITLFRYAVNIYRFHPDRLCAGLGMGYATGMICFWVANFFGCRFNTIETISYFWITSAMIILIRRTPYAPPVAYRTAVPYSLMPQAPCPAQSARP